MEFHEKLQELRKEKGLTQEELAGALFVSRTAVSKWESGRGYPNIDSLKAIAAYYQVTIDELLSGDEILSVAREDHREKERKTKNLIFGLLDLGMVLLFILPLFGQTEEGYVKAVSLFALDGIHIGLKVLYIATVAVMVLFGVVNMALQDGRKVFWSKSKGLISLLLGAIAVALLIVGRQVYGAIFAFLFFVIKVVLLIRRG